MEKPKPTSFAAEFEPAIGLGRRRAPRMPVSLDAQIGRGGLDRALCRVIDISTGGCRIQTYSGIQSGSLIWLTLPGIGHRVAKVVWADDFEAGCEFREPLQALELEAILAD